MEPAQPSAPRSPAAPLPPALMSGSGAAASAVRKVQLTDARPSAAEDVANKTKEEQQTTGEQTQSLQAKRRSKTEALVTQRKQPEAYRLSRKQTVDFHVHGEGSFREAQERQEKALQRQHDKLKDKAELAKLFQRIAEANGSESDSRTPAMHVDKEDLAMFILAMNPSSKISSADFSALLKEFGVSASRTIRFLAFENWWIEMGCLHKGVAARYFCVAESGSFDVGSAAVWVMDCMARIQRFEEEQAVVKLQAQVRQRQTTRTFLKLKLEHRLPGSMRLRVTKMQSHWRMAVARARFREMRLAAIAIQSHERARIAKDVYAQILVDHEKDGYDLASSTVHVGGVGKQWEDERILAEYFSSRFGGILAAVVRYRAPDPPNFPYNSWALVTFRSAKTIKMIFAEAGVEVGDGVAAARAPPTALVPADVDVTFVVRTIDPVKAMTSTGSFGKIFQECRDRVKIARAALRRAREERRRAEEFSRRRMAELAEPAVNTPQKLVMMAHSRHLVVREYADGWLYCRTEGVERNCTCANGQEVAGNRGTGDAGGRYWFNTNTAESRWSAPPCLARLDKTSDLSSRRPSARRQLTGRTALCPSPVTPIQPSPPVAGTKRRDDHAQPGAFPLLSARTIYSTPLTRSPLAIQVSSSGRVKMAIDRPPRRWQQRLPLHVAVGEADVPPIDRAVQFFPEGTGSQYRKATDGTPRRQQRVTPSSPHWVGPERLRTKQLKDSPRHKHSTLRPTPNVLAAKPPTQHSLSTISPRKLDLGADAMAIEKTDESEIEMSPASKSGRAQRRWRMSGSAVLAMRRMLGGLTDADASSAASDGSDE